MGKSWQTAIKGIEIGPGVLDLGGSLRLRYEFLDSFSIRGYGTGERDSMLLERLRLNAEYLVGKDFSLFVQFQDAHFWFSRLDVDRDFGRVCPYQNPMDLKQGFAEWTRIARTPFGFKAGRQAIHYRDNRVWGPGDWGNSGRYTWDGVKLYLDAAPVSTDLIWARRVVSDKNHFDHEHFDFNAWGVYSRTNVLPFVLDLFYVCKQDLGEETLGEAGPGDLLTHSLGFYFEGVLPEGLDWGGLLACQFGDYGRDDVRAFGAHARIGYRFDVAWRPRPALAFTYGSGDRDPGDGTHGTFDGLFGSIDRLYGRMNLFAWMNLEDYQAGIEIRPREKVQISLEYHYFLLAQEKDAWYSSKGLPARQDPTGRAGRDLGQEVDLIAEWKVRSDLELLVGYSHFFPGRFVERTGPAGGADWAFFQVEYSI